MNNSAHENRNLADRQQQQQSNVSKFQLSPLEHRIPDDSHSFTASQSHTQQHQQSHQLQHRHQHKSSQHQFRFAHHPPSSNPAPSNIKQSILSQPPSAMPVSSVQAYPSMGAPVSSSTLHFSSIADTHHSPPHTSFMNNQQSNAVAPPPIGQQSLHTQSQQQQQHTSRHQPIPPPPPDHPPQHRHIDSQPHVQQQQTRSQSQQLLPQHTLLKQQRRPQPHTSSALIKPSFHSGQPQQAQQEPSTQHSQPMQPPPPPPQPTPPQQQQQIHFSGRSDVGSNPPSTNFSHNYSRVGSQHSPLPQHASNDVSGKTADGTPQTLSSGVFPHMSKVHHSAIHPLNHRFSGMVGSGGLHTGTRPAGPKSESIPSMPLPMHPDPVQSFQPVQEVNEPERPFSFPRHNFFDDLTHEESQPTGALPPPGPGHDPDHGNTLGGVDAGLGGHVAGMGPTAGNLPLPALGGGGQTGMHVAGYSPAAGGGGGYSLGGGASDLTEGMSDERKLSGFQRKIRPMARTRAQQMTESQRKQRHNEHTRASRSRIDRGLERLKAVIKKVRPQQKVNKKADVLHEAVKLLKEGFRLPATESDDEQNEPQESSLSV